VGRCQRELSWDAPAACEWMRGRAGPGGGLSLMSTTTVRWTRKQRGAHLEPSFCPHCGRPREAGALYCAYCGQGFQRAPARENAGEEPHRTVPTQQPGDVRPLDGASPAVDAAPYVAPPPPVAPPAPPHREPPLPAGPPMAADIEPRPPVPPPAEVVRAGRVSKRITLLAIGLVVGAAALLLAVALWPRPAVAEMAAIFPRPAPAWSGNDPAPRDFYGDLAAKNGVPESAVTTVGTTWSDTAGDAKIRAVAWMIQIEGVRAEQIDARPPWVECETERLSLGGKAVVATAYAQIYACGEQPSHFYRYDLPDGKTVFLLEDPQWALVSSGPSPLPLDLVGDVFAQLP